MPDPSNAEMLPDVVSFKFDGSSRMLSLLHLLQIRHGKFIFRKFLNLFLTCIICYFCQMLPQRFEMFLLVILAVPFLRSLKDTGMLINADRKDVSLMGSEYSRGIVSSQYGNHSQPKGF